MARQDPSDFGANGNSGCPYCRRVSRWREANCKHVVFIWEPEDGYGHLDAAFKKAGLARLRSLGFKGRAFPAIASAWSDLEELEEHVEEIFPDVVIETRSYRGPAGHGSWFIAFGFSRGLDEKVWAGKAAVIKKKLATKKRQEKAKLAAARSFFKLIERGPVDSVLATLRKRGVSEPVNGGTTSLMWAARSDRTDLVSALLAAGADPGLRDNRGENAVDYALSQSANGSFEALLESSAARAVIEKDADLVWQKAMSRGNERMASLLVARGILPTRRELESSGWGGPLANAVGVHSVPLVRLLLGLGSHVTTAAVWSAMHDDDAPMVDLLLTHAGTIDGMSPVFFGPAFVVCQAIQSLGVFLKHGAPLAWRDGERGTLLGSLLEALPSAKSKELQVSALTTLAREAQSVGSFTEKDRLSIEKSLQKLSSMPELSAAAGELAARLQFPGPTAVLPGGTR